MILMTCSSLPAHKCLLIKVVLALMVHTMRLVCAYDKWLGNYLQALLALLPEPGQPALLWQVRHVPHTCMHQCQTTLLMQYGVATRTQPSRHQAWQSTSLLGISV